MVRARQPEGLKALFPAEKVIITPDADYRYRMEVPESDLINAIENELENMQYDNFKNSIVDHDYHTACSKVWLTQLSAWHDAAATTGAVSDNDRQ